jgi:hypothetical protein
MSRGEKDRKANGNGEATPRWFASEQQLELLRDIKDNAIRRNPAANRNCSSRSPTRTSSTPGGCKSSHNINRKHHHDPNRLYRGAAALLRASSLPARRNLHRLSQYGVGDGYHGKRTASGERFNTYAMTAAHADAAISARRSRSPTSATAAACACASPIAGRSCGVGASICRGPRRTRSADGRGLQPMPP